MDKRLGVETLSELQIWIEGKFELIAQAQNNAHNDLTNIRRTVHDLANELTKVTALNLPEKIAKLEESDRAHEANIKNFTIEVAERRSAMATLKVVYVMGGALIGGVVALAFKFYEMFQG